MKNEKLQFNLFGKQYVYWYNCENRQLNLTNDKYFILRELFASNYNLSDSALEVLYITMQNLIEKAPVSIKQISLTLKEIIYSMFNVGGFMKGILPTDQLRMFFPLIKANHSNSITQPIVDELCRNWNIIQGKFMDYSVDELIESICDEVG